MNVFILAMKEYILSVKILCLMKMFLPLDSQTFIICISYHAITTINDS